MLDEPAYLVVPNQKGYELLEPPLRARFRSELALWLALTTAPEDRTIYRMLAIW